MSRCIDKNSVGTCIYIDINVCSCSINYCSCFVNNILYHAIVFSFIKNIFSLN